MLSNGFLLPVLVILAIVMHVLVELRHMKQSVHGLGTSLQTIEHARKHGWEVLHAIVDSIWIRDVEGRSLEEQHESAMALAEYVHSVTGIPLEYEATYHCIAFLPSRIHSGGSLTKYWAYGNEGMKIRGLELRQHSTCVWIARLQKQALHILADTDDLVEGIRVIESNLNSTSSS